MSIGSQSIIIFDADASTYANFDINSTAMPFTSESIKTVKGILRDQQMRNTRQRTGDRNKDGAEAFRGSVTIQPTKTELDILLPYILGAAEGTSDAFALADTLPEFSIMLKRDRWLYVYTGCKVDVATFRSSRSAEILEVELVLEIRTMIKSSSETVPGTVPAFSALSPFAHHNSTLSLYGGAKIVDDLSLSINNFLTKDRHYNSLTQQELLPQDREIILAGTMPSDSTTDSFFNTYSASEVGGSLTYADGINSLAFTLGLVSINPDNENANTKDEIKKQWTAEIMATGATASLAVVNKVLP